MLQQKGTQTISMLILFSRHAVYAVTIAKQLSKFDAIFLIFCYKKLAVMFLPGFCEDMQAFR